MPTESRKRRRSPISRTTSRAIARSVSVSSRPSIHSERRPRRLGRVLVDVEPADRDREALRAQPSAAARRAGLQRHQLLDPLAGVLRVGVLVAALEAVEHAVEADRVGALAPEAVLVGDGVALLAGALEQQLAVLLREVAPGGRRRRSRWPRRPPRAAGGGTSRPPSPTARARPRRSRASGRGRSAPDRSRAGSRARGIAGSSRAAS